MNKDYFVILSTDRKLEYTESRFVVRAKNALMAEEYALKICEKKKEKDKGNWQVWEIKRI